jgi:hypothetical protein
MSLRKTDPDSRTAASAADHHAVKKALAHGFAPDIRSRRAADRAHLREPDRTNDRQSRSHRPA